MTRIPAVVGFSLLCCALGLQMNSFQHLLMVNNNDNKVDNKVVTIAVQYFKHAQTIDLILSGFNKSSVVKEVIFADDSHDVDWSEHEKEGKYQFEVKHLVQPNLHEIRNYNAMSKVAEGDYIVFWQDDNVPTDPAYLADAVTAFKTYPQLGVIALDPAMKKNPPRFIGKEMKERGTIGAHWAGDYGMPEIDVPKDVPDDQELREPVTGRRMAFCFGTSLFAYMTPKATFLEHGGFDEKYSEPGQPGIGFEEAHGLKTWAKGKMFAVMDVRDLQSKEDIGVGGHASKDKSNPNSKLRMTNEKKNIGLMGEEFGSRMSKIGDSIIAANTCMVNDGSTSEKLQLCLDTTVPKVPEK